MNVILPWLHEKLYIFFLNVVRLSNMNFLHKIVCLIQFSLNPYVAPTTTGLEGLFEQASFESVKNQSFDV